MDEDCGNPPGDRMEDAIEDLAVALDRLDEALDDADVTPEERLRLVDEVAIPALGSLHRLQAATLRSTRAAVRDALAEGSRREAGSDTGDPEPRGGSGAGGTPTDPSTPADGRSDDRSPAKRVEDAIDDVQRALDGSDDAIAPDADVVRAARALREELDREVAAATRTVRDSSSRHSTDDHLDWPAGPDVDVESELETLKRQRAERNADLPDWADDAADDHDEADADGTDVDSAADRSDTDSSDGEPDSRDAADH